MKFLALSLLILSFLPIWRIAGSKEGYNAWQVLSQGYQKHIGTEEATERAVEAYHLAGSAG